MPVPCAATGAVKRRETIANWGTTLIARGQTCYRRENAMSTWRICARRCAGRLARRLSGKRRRRQRALAHLQFVDGADVRSDEHRLQRRLLLQRPQRGQAVQRHQHLGRRVGERDPARSVDGPAGAWTRRRASIRASCARRPRPSTCPRAPTKSACPPTWSTACTIRRRASFRRRRCARSCGATS